MSQGTLKHLSRLKSTSEEPFFFSSIPDVHYRACDVCQLEHTRSNKTSASCYQLSTTIQNDRRVARVKAGNYVNESAGCKVG